MRATTMLLVLLLAGAPMLATPAAALGRLHGEVSLSGPARDAFIPYNTSAGSTFSGRAWTVSDDAPVRLVPDAFARLDVSLDGAPWSEIFASSTGTFQLTIHWPTPGRHVVTVVDVDFDDTVPASAVIVVANTPSPPRAPALDFGQPWSAGVLSWQPPASDGYAPIVAYRVDAWDFVARRWNAVANVSSTSVGVHVAANGTYRYRVFAMNQLAQWSNATVLDAHMAPEPVPIDTLSATIRQVRAAPGGSALRPGYSYDANGSVELWMSGYAFADGVAAEGFAVPVTDRVEFRQCAGNTTGTSCDPSGPVEVAQVDGIGTAWPDGSYSTTLRLPRPPSYDAAPGWSWWEARIVPTAHAGTATASDSGVWHAFKSGELAPCPPEGCGDPNSVGGD